MVLGELIVGANLQELNLSYNKLDGAALRELNSALGLKDGRLNTLKLESLSFRGNLLSSESFQFITPFFYLVQTLDLSENDLGDAFFQSMFLQIANEDKKEECFRLNSLILRDSSITERTVILITSNLELFPKLENLTTSYNGFDDITSQPMNDLYTKILLRKRSSMLQSQLI